MALFFDYRWFDNRLAEKGLTRADVASCLSLSPGEVDQLFKDQREMSANDVLAVAQLIGCEAAQVADRAGVSTPVPKKTLTADEKLAQMAAQIARLEAELLRMRDRVQSLEMAAAQNVRAKNLD